MPAYLVRLTLQSPLATPLISGTLFGHLCWAWRELDGENGEESLERWLASLPEEPFLLSSGCPAGFLPVPQLAPSAPVPQEPAGLHHLREIKKARKLDWLPVEDFLALRPALGATALLERLRLRVSADPLPERGLRSDRVAHNTIDRRTGTTPAVGGLYFVDREVPPPAGCTVDVYVQTALSAARLEALFAHVGKHGYGRDATLGCGAFSASVGHAPAALFDHPGNRLFTLSHGSLTPNMTAPRYRIHPHYGKVGGQYAPLGNPFKYPMTLLRPGAAFSAAGPSPFGELLQSVHPSLPGVRHNAWHLALPYTEV